MPPSVSVDKRRHRGISTTFSRDPRYVMQERTGESHTIIVLTHEMRVAGEVLHR